MNVAVHVRLFVVLAIWGKVGACTSGVVVVVVVLEVGPDVTLGPSVTLSSETVVVVVMDTVDMSSAQILHVVSHSWAWGHVPQ